MGWCTASDGVPVAVHDLGGDGPPIVFAHATGFHGRVWEPVAAFLVRHYRCWSFDERGHGATPAREDLDFSWHGFARDALAVVDGLGLERPLGVGHSAGGAALLLAEQQRPGTFAALYCYEPVVIPSGRLPPGRQPGENPLAAGARRRRDVFPSRQAAYEHYASRAPFLQLHPDALRAYVEHGFTDRPDGTVQLACRPEHEARTYEMGFAHGAFERLAEVRCPVTVAGGELADTFTPEIVALQAAQLPAGRAETLPGLGHFGPLQDPAAVAASIERALAGAG